MHSLSTAVKLFVAIAVSQAAGLIGSFFTMESVREWYPTLLKPALTPPSWVFAPVWTTLYVLMGIAAFLVWRKGLNRKDVQVALGVFLFQLVLNTLWSVLFFGARMPGLAFLEIAVLWLSIVLTMFLFARISKIAAWLLVPYLLWVSFAAYLNAAIWVLN